MILEIAVRDKATGEVYTSYRDTSLLSYKPGTDRSGHKPLASLSARRVHRCFVDLAYREARQCFDREHLAGPLVGGEPLASSLHHPGGVDQRLDHRDRDLPEPSVGQSDDRRVEDSTPSMRAASTSSGMLKPPQMMILEAAPLCRGTRPHQAGRGRQFVANLRCFSARRPRRADSPPSSLVTAPRSRPAHRLAQPLRSDLRWTVGRRAAACQRSQADGGRRAHP